MKPLVSMRRALTDKALLGGILPGPSWRMWRVLLIAIMGEALRPKERELFKAMTGREHEPGAQVEEAWCIAGRRSGKTRAGSVLAVYVAGMCEHKLAPGERGLALFLAMNVKQAALAFSYAAAIFDSVPMLRRMVTNRTDNRISLSNGSDLEIRPASFRGLRGVTTTIAVCDEIGYWLHSEQSLNADSEIIAAIKPSLATTGGPLVCVTTPYSRRGEAWRAFHDHYGPSGDPALMIAQGPSRLFNPSLPESVVDRAYARDASAAAAEYGGLFRTDIESFVPVEVVAACVGDHFELGPMPQHKYFAFCDPAGGSGQDSFTMAIVHKEGERIIVDAIRESPPPFSPEGVTNELVILLNSYGIRHIFGDHYAGSWPREQFSKRGVEYLCGDKPKSDLYRDLLPLLNSGTVVLPRSERLVNQLCGLERRTARSGKDSIDHGPGANAHDDVANCVAGAVDCLAGALLRRPGGVWFQCMEGRADQIEAKQWGREAAAAGSAPCLLGPADFGDPVQQNAAMDRLAAQVRRADEKAKAARPTGLYANQSRSPGAGGRGGGGWSL
jgi:hypothetical protein